MSKNPHEPDIAPEPEGDRAGKRLRDQMMGRFPGGTFPSPEGEKPDADETPEDAGPEQKDEPDDT